MQWIFSSPLDLAGNKHGISWKTFAWGCDEAGRKTKCGLDPHWITDTRCYKSSLLSLQGEISVFLNPRALERRQDICKVPWTKEFDRILLIIAEFVLKVRKRRGRVHCGWGPQVYTGLTTFPWENFLQCAIHWHRSGFTQPVLHFNQFLLLTGCSLECPPIPQVVLSGLLFFSIILSLLSFIFFLAGCFHLLKALI